MVKLLKKKDGFTIEKSSPGIYYINNDTFEIQIIVIPELPPEENLYLRCLTDNLQDISMVNRLTEDFTKHRNQEIYNKYLRQLSTANLKTKGESFMVNEWIFNLFGTSSDEIIAHAKQESEEYYLPKLNELTATNEQQASSIKQLTSSNMQLSSSNKQLSSQIESLKNLLKQHNISYE